jgi:hypothetical protein
MSMMRIKSNSRLLFALFLMSVMVVVSWTVGDAQAPAAGQPAAQGQARPAAPPPGANACPGEAMGVQATGVYTPKPVPEIVINGQPGPGAIWSAGMRSYWHCHAGGQIMMLFDGAGRVQKRGERIRTLHKGDTEYAGPGVEHWHGAAPDASAQFFQTSIGVTTTLWMEEVGNDDYMGNDNGLASRAEFLKSGVRKKYESVQQAMSTAQGPKK